MSFLEQNKEFAKAKPFVTAVIVAAGNSTRMGGVNKQFLLIDGVPVLIRTLLTFSQSDMIKEYKVLKVTDIVKGGKTRQESVFNAIRRSSPLSEYFAIHDGARPLVTEKIIEDTVREAFSTGAAATGVRVKDTVKVVNENGFITATPDRNYLWAVHTPQVFERRLYLSAIDNVLNSVMFTDDCKLLEEYGAEVKMVEGSYENIKITTPEDTDIAQAILYRREQL